MSNNKTSTVKWGTLIFSYITSMIGYHIHGSIGWAIFDFILAPIVWLKWLICKEITLSIIKETFSFFFK